MVRGASVTIGAWGWLWWSSADGGGLGRLTRGVHGECDPADGPSNFPDWQCGPGTATLLYRLLLHWQSTRRSPASKYAFPKT